MLVVTHSRRIVSSESEIVRNSNQKVNRPVSGREHFMEHPNLAWQFLHPLALIFPPGCLGAQFYAEQWWRDWCCWGSWYKGVAVATLRVIELVVQGVHPTDGWATD